MSVVARKQAGWRELHLDDLVERDAPICYGIVLPGLHHDGGVPVVKVKDISQGSIRTDRLLLTSPAIDSRYRRSRLKEGDILLSIRGTIGRVGIVPKSLAGANITQDTARLRIGSKDTRDYVFQVLQSEQIQRQIMHQVVGQAVQGINIRDVRRLRFLFPTQIKAQHFIVELLATSSSAIEKTEKLVAAKRRYYEYEIARVIGRAKHHRDHIDSVAHEVSTRNRGCTCNLVLSVTNTRGFVLPEDQFERRVASDDLSNYKIVSKGQYAYNPSRINVGSIARLDDFEKGVLSPMYVVFALNRDKVNSDYFKHWLTSHEARERIKKSAQGSVRETVSFAEFASIPFPHPTIDRQLTISRYLNALYGEIVLLDKFVVRLTEQKRGLMRKILAGQWPDGTIKQGTT